MIPRSKIAKDCNKFVFLVSVNCRFLSLSMTYTSLSIKNMKDYVAAIVLYIKKSPHNKVEGPRFKFNGNV